MIHACHVSRPAQFAFSNALVDCLHFQPVPQDLVRYSVLSCVPARDSAHATNALIVKDTESLKEFLSQTPTFSSTQKNVEDDGQIHQTTR